MRITYQGIEYKSISVLCRKLGLSLYSIYNRVHRGDMSLDQAIAYGNINLHTIQARDHKGIEFPNFHAMCKAYNKFDNTVSCRLDRGWSLEKALTTEVKRIWKDHLGNRYLSRKDLCKHYNITVDTFYYRTTIVKWSLEKTLTTPINQRSIECVDSFGNKFKSIREMCEYHHVDTGVFQRKAKQGLSTDRILSTYGIYKRK